MRRLPAILLLLLTPALSFAQAWSDADKAMVDALSWIHWTQWIQNGLLSVLIAAAVIFTRGGR